MIPVYNDTEDLGVIINWSNVVRPHFKKRVTTLFQIAVLPLLYVWLVA
jgi:hypothetical protein